MVTYCSLHRSCALVCFLVLYLLQQEGGGGGLGQLHHKNAKCPITPRPGMLLRCTFVVWPLAIVLCDLPCPLDLCLLPCKIKNYSLWKLFSCCSFVIQNYSLPIIAASKKVLDHHGHACSNLLLLPCVFAGQLLIC